MSDDIELASGEYVAIQDRVCECRHRYDDHAYGAACEEPSCPCLVFVASWEDAQSL